MDYTLFGNSGLNVSKYALGTIPFSGTKGFEEAGDMNQETANYMIDYALDKGINHFDTANLYAKGDSEIVLGKAMKDKRHKMVLNSKTGFDLGDDPNAYGTSRMNIESSIDKTLNRLDTDYIDLYYAHLWDGQVPDMETIQAMNDLIRKGKIRYWGVSNYSGWQLARTHTLAVENNLIPPIAQQIYYSPESRESEYELLPAGKELGVANSIWGALGEGLLTGKITRNKKAESGTRQGNGWPEPYIKDLDQFYNLVDVLQDIASKHGSSVSQVTLAWTRQRPNVDSVVIGARNKEQLYENIDSYNLELTNEDMKQINEASPLEPIYPLWHRAMNSSDRTSDAEKQYMKEYNEVMKNKNQDI